MELKQSATKQKKEAAEWIIQNFDCKPSTARYLANEACNMAWTFNYKGGLFQQYKKNTRFQKYDSKEPGGVKSTTVEISYWS